MRLRQAFLWIAVALAVDIGVAQADEWRWTRVAFEDTNVNSVVCPPDSPQVLYATIDGWTVPADRAGVYKSTDNAVTWRYLPESNNWDANALTVDAKDQAIVYCGAYSCVYGAWAKRSRDAGEHWEDVEKVINRIVASPWRYGHLLATQTFMNYSLHRSTDDGLTWQAICGGEEFYPSGQVLFHREDSLQAFAYLNYWPGGDGLGRTTDGGDSWEVVLPGLIVAFDQDPLNGTHWVAIRMDIAPAAVYFAESYDDGNTWRLSNLPCSTWWVRQVAFDKHDPEVVYLVVAEHGVWRSVDGGQRWAPMNEGFVNPSGGIHGVFQTGYAPGELLCARTDGLWRWTDQQAATDPREASAGTLRLTQLAPCPFHDTIRAQLTLDRPCQVEAGVYSLRGTSVRSLLNRPLGPGEHVLLWDGNDALGYGARPGTYLLVVRTGSERVVGRLLKTD